MLLFYFIEMEPYDEDLKSQINGTLLPVLDDAVTTATLKRKHCPLTCANYSAKTFKCVKEYYVRISYLMWPLVCLLV